MDKTLLNKFVKYGKWALCFLYVAYLAVIIVNIAFQLKGGSNNIIQTSGAWGYVLTYGLSILLASGFFVIPTVVQAIVFYVFKKNIAKSFIALVILEAIKIVGTSIYIYMIDFSNIRFGGAVTAFIILGMIIFGVIAALEIALSVAMKLSEKSET